MRKEIKIAIFALVTIFCLYWGINFLRGKDLFKSNRVYYAYYDNVSGIAVTSPIIIKGISIGSVTKISFRPDMDNKVELQLSVKSAYKIPENSVAKIASTGIIGGKAIEFELGTSDKYLPDGSVIESQDETSIFDVAGSELDQLKQALSSIMKNLDRTLEGLNVIIGDDGGDIKRAIANIESITASLDRTISTKVDPIVDDLAQLSGALAGSSQSIKNSLTSIEQVSGELADSDLGLTVAKLSETVDGLNTVLASLNSTDGSLGLLLNDTQLYDSLAMATANLSSLLADIEKNPGRYVHVSVFGRKNK